MRNELVTGHLGRFLDVNAPLLDKIYAFDDFSDDGTADALRQFGAQVLSATQRSFKNELLTKNDLLNLIRNFELLGTWVFRLDADEICIASRSELEEMCQAAELAGFDSISLPNINLWKSESYYRIDDNYDKFRPVRLWKLSPDVIFPRTRGLHVTSDPVGLKSTLYSADFPTLHYGFATQKHVVDKAVSYWFLGQRGYPLNRLLLDRSASLKPVHEFPGKLGRRSHLIGTSQAPAKISQMETLLDFNRRICSRQTKPKITLVSLIFSGVEWLEMQYTELLKLSNEFDAGHIEILFIANDPTKDVKDFLDANLIPHRLFRGKNAEDEWYINSVYRAYNFGVQESTGELVLLVNSDMVYAPGFLSSMLKHANESAFVTSKLIEQGVLESGQFGVEKSFGSNPKNFRRKDFERYASRIETEGIIEGGLYMPLLVSRATFLELGGFPEGNLAPSALAGYLAGDKPQIANKGQACISGDTAFFEKAKASGIRHVTALGAICYHFQEGELRTSKRKVLSTLTPSGVWVVNDSMRGVNGERVFWGRIMERLSTSGVRVEAIEPGRPTSPFWAALLPLKVLLMSLRQRFLSGPPRLIFQNGTYIGPVPFGVRRTAIVQDRVSRGWLRVLQTIVRFTSDTVVTNDLNYFESAKGSKMRWLQLPLDAFWLENISPSERRSPVHSKLRILFVGAFNATKGISTLENLIQQGPNFNWTVVSKNKLESNLSTTFLAKNVTLLTHLSPGELLELYRNHDVLVVTSPKETQHLASLEALSQGLPVATTPTGLLGSLGEGIFDFGIVSNELSIEIIEEAAKREFSPTKVLEYLALDETTSLSLWDQFFREELQKSFAPQNSSNAFSLFFQRAWSAMQLEVRKMLRRAKSSAMLALRRRKPF